MLNKAQIIGYVGRDPEMRTFPSGDRVANLSIATTEKWKDKQSGEMKEATEWHRINFNGRLAEIVGEYVRKGSLIYVEGSLKTRKWTDKDGVEKYSTEIRADRMQMLGGNRDDRGGGDDGNTEPRGNFQRERSQAENSYRRGAPAATPGQPQRGGGQTGFDDMDDDIPF